MAVIKQKRIIAIVGAPSAGGGNVDSVNGKTGVVVLTGEDIPLLNGTTNPTITEYLAVNKVDSVQAGSNIQVDDSDPLNPIVSTVPTTSAGLLSRTYLTGDEETITAGTFYKSNRDNEGTAQSVVPTVVVNNSTVFFSQDIIGDPYPIETTIPKGNYSGNISVGATNSAFDKFRYDIEIYLCDNDGNPVNSGITGQPTGDLGVQIVTQAHTTEFSVGVTVSELIEPISAVLTGDLVIPLGYRIRYHVSATKLGGGNSTCSLFLGTDHVNYVDVPVASFTNTVINTDLVKFPNQSTQYDVNRDLDKTIRTFTELFSGATINANANKEFLVCNFSSDDTLTIEDNALEVGEILYVHQSNSGVVTLVGGGSVVITPNSSGNLVTVGQGDTLALLKVNTNDFQMI